MNERRVRALAVVALLTAIHAWSASADASEPPPTKGDSDTDREADMFGGTKDEAAPAQPAPPTAETSRNAAARKPKTAPGPAAPDGAGGAAEADVQGSATTPVGKDYGDKRWSDAGVTTADIDRLKDKLDIGGLLYLRNNAAIAADTLWSRQTLSSSNLMDVYFDARPNDRLRAFVRGRLLYSPVISSQQSAALTGLTANTATYQTQLVEMWIKFDIARWVYLTVGTQQLRWGTTRLWNPVDVINSTRRNPLTLFDQRTGLPMVKLHFPIDSLGWNAYLLALGERADNLRNWGVAGRLEMVLSTVEVGLTAMKRMDFDPRVGVDWSAGIWDIDVTGELGVRVDAAGDAHWMLSAGVSYTLEIGEDDSIIFGAEYFHNPEGFSDGKDAAQVLIDWSVKAQLSPSTAGPMPLTFFYTGKHYASLFAVAMGPGSWNDTALTLSAIGNLSDGTGFVQFLMSTKVLKDLSVEGFVAANVGGDGEFRFYSGYLNDAISAQLGGNVPAALKIARPLGQIGLNLRMSF